MPRSADPKAHIAALLRLFRPVFVDIRADTQNIDETKIEAAITSRTRAICCVHYGGVACEMDAIMAIASRHGLLVVEDNAHGFHGSYKGKMLGSIGDVAALSFHCECGMLPNAGAACCALRRRCSPRTICMCASLLGERQHTVVSPLSITHTHTYHRGNENL